MTAKIEAAIEHRQLRIDRSRSSIAFRVRHFGVATVRGHFGSFASRLEADDDGLRIVGQVDVASLETGNADRDARLRSGSSAQSAFPRLH